MNQIISKLVAAIVQFALALGEVRTKVSLLYCHC